MGHGMERRTVECVQFTTRHCPSENWLALLVCEGLGLPLLAKVADLCVPRGTRPAAKGGCAEGAVRHGLLEIQDGAGRGIL